MSDTRFVQSCPEISPDPFLHQEYGGRRRESEEPVLLAGNPCPTSLASFGRSGVTTSSSSVVVIGQPTGFLQFFFTLSPPFQRGGRRTGEEEDHVWGQEHVEDGRRPRRNEEDPHHRLLKVRTKISQDYLFIVGEIYRDRVYQTFFKVK